MSCKLPSVVTNVPTVFTCTCVCIWAVHPHAYGINLISPFTSIHVVSDGRDEDRLYQVMTDSETLVGDMPLDGILVLEMSESGTEADLAKQDSYTQLMSPMREPPSYVPYIVVDNTSFDRTCMCVPVWEWSLVHFCMQGECKCWHTYTVSLYPHI